mmetsp:Transcript_32103/g.103609  ORF Transcript_32103/g.103609 Transcript_32103/m.103609 type:complete len:264 (-) Transcript_32103:83-874(-)
MCPHRPSGGALSESSATIRSSSVGIASSAALLAHESHRSGGAQSGAGTPARVASADFARRTASARPTSESPRGERPAISPGRLGTTDSGNTSRPTESSSCASVRDASTVARFPISVKSVASSGCCEAKASACCRSVMASSASIWMHSFSTATRQSRLGPDSCRSRPAARRCSSCTTCTSPWQETKTSRCCADSQTRAHSRLMSSRVSVVAPLLASSLRSSVSSCSTSEPIPTRAKLSRTPSESMPATNRRGRLCRLRARCPAP